MRLLVVEDDPLIADGLVRTLRSGGHAVDHAADGATADRALAQYPYDLVVLDLGLPAMDGMEVLRRARARGSATPVLVLTARDALDDRVAGLDAGADDYLPKPFDLPELEARVRALLRRREGLGTNRLILGNLVIDLGGHSAFHGAARIDLSSREFGVLETLARRAGRVVSKEQILEAMTGWGEDVGVNAVEVYVHRLRRKIEPAGVNIRTVRGLGYLLEKGAAP
ncbi:MAG: response regulator transcription factor [Rhodocyclaceae bacterium]|jgi:two-component system OmpR family response regulator|nr:response regulator transcription factor [Rhodocyclaceae bacterium]MCA3146262.1 response regulator transcription factor [Rhodocyclaceae bacterium]